MGKYALLIGVSEYGEGLQALPAAPNDVAAFAEVLQNPQFGGFDEVKPVLNPNQADMAREIELWFQGREPDDLVLLFFSGHGVKDERRDLFFAARNTEKQRDRLIRSTATSARFIHDCIRSCKAKYQVIILDCCFSGAFGDLLARDDGEINLKEQLGAEGRVVLTSTSAVDYSFEEKGADLSIYTRYLVEGIVSGAADADEDGIITVEELHRFAGRKVEETSPAMSPKIITLKDEGYRIRLVKAPQDDPKVQYRKEVERRAAAGRFTIPAQRLLQRYRQELGIAEDEAASIEAEVLRPYQEYQLKRQEYQDTLLQCLQEETTLSSRTSQDLIDFREHLRLKPEDVTAIERAALQGSSLEEYVAHIERRRQEAAIQQQQAVYAQNLDRYQQEFARALETRYPLSQRVLELLQNLQQNLGVRDEDVAAIEHPLREAAEANYQRQLATSQPVRDEPDDLTSEKGIDYTHLRNLLKAGKWREADKETYEIMIRSVSKKSSDWFSDEELQNFPCTDLRTIDGLWVKYSQGKFGFSVQKQIYVECGAKLDNEYPGDEIWHEFCERVGWRKGGKYLDYSDLKANPSLPLTGEFPFGNWVLLLGEVGASIGYGLGSVLFSRIETCKL